MSFEVRVDIPHIDGFNKAYFIRFLEVNVVNGYERLDYSQRECSLYFSTLEKANKAKLKLAAKTLLYHQIAISVHDLTPKSTKPSPPKTPTTTPVSPQKLTTSITTPTSPSIPSVPITPKKPATPTTTTTTTTSTSPSSTPTKASTAAKPPATPSTPSPSVVSTKTSVPTSTTTTSTLSPTTTTTTSATNATSSPSKTVEPTTTNIKNDFTPTGATNSIVTVYVAGLPPGIGQLEFHNLFSTKTTGVKTCKKFSSKAKHFGFVNYNSTEDAFSAIQLMDNYLLGDARLEVRLKDIYLFNDSQSYTLKVDNLAREIKDHLFLRIFSVSPEIREGLISAHVAVDSSGESKGFGFLEYSNEDSANSVQKQMNDKPFYDNVLSVSHVSDGSKILIKVSGIPEVNSKDFCDFIMYVAKAYVKDIYSCFVKTTKGIRFGIVMVKNLSAAGKLMQVLEGSSWRDHKLKVLFRGKPGEIDKSENDVLEITGRMEEKLSEQREMEKQTQLEKLLRAQEKADPLTNLLKTKEELEERLRAKQERIMREEVVRRELQDIQDQLEVAKLEADIQEFKAQKELEEMEMDMLAAINDLEAQKKMIEIQENIVKFEQEIEEKKELKDEILTLQERRKAYDVELDCTPPVWREDEDAENVDVLSYRLYKNEILQAQSERRRVRIMQKPFARGSFRLAYWVKEVGGEVYVAKKPILSKDGDFASCKNDILTQLYADHMAKEFCKLKPPKLVEYAPIYLLCFSDRNPRVYMTMEKVLDGEWKRYSNNKGYVHEENTGTVHAFSHFTYQYSELPKKIVVDIQGVKYNNNFLLTDPSVHCTLKLFGDSNLGQEGIVEFFKTHTCNQVCKLLNLTKPLL